MPKHTVYYNNISNRIELITEFRKMFLMQLEDDTVLLIQHTTDKKILKRLLKEPIVYKRLGAL